MRLFLTNIFLFITACFRGQTGLFVNGPDASLRVDSLSYMSIEGDLQNLDCDPVKYVRFNGTLYLSGNLVNSDILKFTATTGPGNSKKAKIVFNYSSAYPSGINALIGGSVTPGLWETEIDKSSAGSITLNNNVNCYDTLNFKAGSVYMNGFKWNLTDPTGVGIINHPYLKNERNGCQFRASSINDTGLIILKTTYNYSLNLDPANIGILIGGSVNVGSKFNVRRGFKPQVNAGKTSILRYFDIHSPGHSLSINSINVKYTYNDLNFFPTGYFDLQQLKLSVSNGGDINWSFLPSTIQNTLVSTSMQNGVLFASLSDLNLPNINLPDTFFRITIADTHCIDPPLSNLLADTLHICSGNTVLLDAGNNSFVSNNPLRWEWNTNPKIYTQTYSVIPTTSYQKYTVKLMDSRGCETTDSVVIAPQAAYPQITYLNHLNSCLGDSIIIKDTVKLSTGTYTNSWLFSDGSLNTSILSLFKKKFSTAGDHSFQLTSTSNYGCSVTKTATNVIVYPLPTVDFISKLDCVSGITTFTNTSLSNHPSMIISSSSWNLGHGASNTSTLTSPSHGYSTVGTYTVRLTSATIFGCKDSTSKTIDIYPLNLALFAKNNTCLGDTVFLNNGSICNTGNCSYNWSFGDGIESTLASPKKVYSTSGIYPVKLKVTTPFGCPDSLSTSIFINPKPNTQFSVTQATSCINNFIYFTNTSTIGVGSLAGYSWNLGNTTVSTSTNSFASYSTPGIYNVSLIAASDSGCTNSKTVLINIQPQPFAFYTVSNSCLGSPSQFASSSSGQGLTYAWNYGNAVITNTSNATVQNYVYPASGIYTTQLIVFSTWGCSDTSSVVTSVLPTPLIALGGSISTCGNAYTLDAGNPGSSYAWLPGNQVTQTVHINTTGIYQVNITNTNNCIGTETVFVILNDIVKPKLGNDSTVCGAFILNAGYPGSIHAWNTSAVSQTIVVPTSGTYIVQVNDQNGCAGSDTINLFVNTPVSLSLGNNLTICKPKYGFTLSPITNATNFLWSNGITSPSLNINLNGSYWLEGSLTNGCKFRDTINIIFLNTPHVNLGTDKSVCGNILLDAHNAGCVYLWNDGNTNQTLNTIKSDNYWLKVTNPSNNCFQEDSINVMVHPSIHVFLGNDTVFCNNSNFSLNAQNSGSTYSWTSGQSSQSISISSSGIYGVTVKNTNGCFASDYISITLVRAPLVDLGPDVRYLCGNNKIDLQVGSAGQVRWGSTVDINSTEKFLSINQPGKYWAEILEFGCSSNDSILVIATNNTIQAIFLASTIDTVNTPVKFISLSVPKSTTQLWNFGDGVTSTELNPLHTFVLPQNFSVTLEVSNGFCSDKITKQLNVLFKRSASTIHQPINKLELLSYNVYPNPSASYLQIDFELNDSAPIDLQIFDMNGKLIVKDSETSIHYFPKIQTSEFKAGLYILNIQVHTAKGNIIKTTKFIKTN